MKCYLNQYIALLLALIFITSCAPEVKEVQVIPDDEPRRIELLFLGHASEHHNSRAYLPILASALTQSGINLTYTEDVQDLNKENLSLYDGVVIYANHEGRHPDQEDALMEFVSEGHAFIPIHCASFCFKDSDEYIDLVGGQFLKHGTDTFTTSITDGDHPAMQGLSEFSTWDETYVHQKLANDIQVLMERQEGNEKEPWTWVKNYGKGKVFYTAYGHDERTWNQPGFQELIKQGILWAVDENTKKNWEAYMTDMPTLEYRYEAKIPNYEQRDPAPQFQLPLTPEASAKLIQIPPDFKLELFASEPDIINPIAINWDERGRLWAIETVDYPNRVRDDKSSGDDVIKILEDTNGDGKADKVTVFADKLNLPTSFAFVNGGIIVSQAPHFLFLKDTDGDDKADVREIVIDGWGINDTHAGPSNLQIGMDNKIYGVLGYSGFEGSIFDEPFKFSQGIYRFDRGYNEFEYLSRTSNNTWGLGFTEGNSVFASTANNTHSVYLGIEDRFYNNVSGLKANGSKKIDGHYDMQPITPNYRQVDVFGGFTAAAGHHFYTARDYPQRYWDNMALVCEPTGGLVHVAKIKKEGAGYLEYDGGNIFASSDEWVSPVEAKVGPDGNIWVADWYNFIVQHNPTPSEDFGGFKGNNGAGNAYENPLRDKSRGRIWRIVPEQGTSSVAPVLSLDNPNTLVDALSHSNMFWRMTAQRMIIEGNLKKTVPELSNLLNNKELDELGNSPAALHALWTLHGLGAISSNKVSDIVIDALSHPAASVRRAAIQMMPNTQEADDVLMKANILEDSDHEVLLTALLYFSKSEPSIELGQLLYTLSESQFIKDDQWLSNAVYIAGANHRNGFMASYLLNNATLPSIEEGLGNPSLEDFNDASWETMTLPTLIENAGLEIDGKLWFRKNISLPNSPSQKTGTINLGPIDDSDSVFVNGVFVGSLMGKYSENRSYEIPKGVLKSGDNVISVWVEDTGGGGGIYGKPEQMYLRVNGEQVSLSGDWKYVVAEDESGQLNIFEEKSISQVLYENYHGHPQGTRRSKEKEIKKAIDPDATVIKIKTLPNEMKYDIKEFEVKAGSSVQVEFENNDFMQHNLIIGSIGGKIKIGQAADAMASESDAAERNYIPDVPEVLHATAIVDPNETVVLNFLAPSQPGNYPYVCTFPGHWRIMQGNMKVIP